MTRCITFELARLDGRRDRQAHVLIIMLDGVEARSGPVMTAVGEIALLWILGSKRCYTLQYMATRFILYVIETLTCMPLPRAGRPF
jgi:hypothetical protein